MVFMHGTSGKANVQNPGTGNQGQAPGAQDSLVRKQPSESGHAWTQPNYNDLPDTDLK
jgi:hypothetical protein